jgi:hypothetical protein
MFFQIPTRPNMIPPGDTITGNVVPKSFTEKSRDE